jgi:hypothetical protein
MQGRMTSALGHLQNVFSTAVECQKKEKNEVQRSCASFQASDFMHSAILILMSSVSLLQDFVFLPVDCAELMPKRAK